ncbi:Gfo/Idh/MocA family oxidoreductase [Nostocoides veronense]|uniref:Gfo/Idh/MocA family oxidoreductase n=1 Tax=Nostocoides veronense TaxID=330836 RepID=A0ABP4Y8Q9_9MICO
MPSLPVARTLDPREAPALRWGILGTGWNAEKFTTALRRHTTQQVYAVGSRTQASADRFAAAVGAPVAHGTYEALVADPHVDIIYVATPHNFHHEHALLAIAAGKHVLIEKPIAVSESEAQDIANRAAAAGVFCMEAFWTLFLPKYDVLTQLMADMAIDAVLADMGEYFTLDHRIFDPALAGGPIFDMATYPLSIALWALGDPAQISANGAPAPNGINGQLAITMESTRGGLAALHTSIVGETPTTATFAGLDATIVVDGPFYQPGGFTYTTRAGARLRYDEERSAHEGGLHFQAAAVARHIAAGETSSPVRPLADSIRLLRVMDEIRAQVGIPLP